MIDLAPDHTGMHTSEEFSGYRTAISESRRRASEAASPSSSYGMVNKYAAL